MNPTTRILNDALDALRNVGWTQGLAYDIDTGSRCTLGGLAIAAEHLAGDLSENLDGACRMFEAANGIDLYGIPKWNDQPDRTFEDVVIAFELAILESKRDIA